MPFDVDQQGQPYHRLERPILLIAEIKVRMVIWIDRGAIAKDTIATKYN